MTSLPASEEYPVTDRRLLVLDDDPTGSQCVAGVDVVLEPDPAVAAGALAEPGSTSTSRSMTAASLNCW